MRYLDQIIKEHHVLNKRKEALYFKASRVVNYGDLNRDRTCDPYPVKIDDTQILTLYRFTRFRSNNTLSINISYINIIVVVQ
jgi:hypothetical protein